MSGNVWCEWSTSLGVSTLGQTWIPGWFSDHVLGVAHHSAARVYSVHSNPNRKTFNGLVSGKIYRKTPYFMGKSMVSCRFSLKPIHWDIYLSVCLSIYRLVDLSIHPSIEPIFGGIMFVKASKYIYIYIYICICHRNSPWNAFRHLLETLTYSSRVLT